MEAIRKDTEILKRSKWNTGSWKKNPWNKVCFEWYWHQIKHKRSNYPGEKWQVMLEQMRQFCDVKQLVATLSGTEGSPRQGVNPCFRMTVTVSRVAWWLCECSQNKPGMLALKHNCSTRWPRQGCESEACLHYWARENQTNK